MERDGAPLGLESRERAAAAGGCVAVYLRLQGGLLRSSGSADRRCRWPRAVPPPSTAGLAGSPGHGPGRPSRPAGAECCGTPGRGPARPGPASARRLCPRPPACLRHLVLLLLLSSVFRIAEGCSSRAKPEPRGPSPSTRRPYVFNTEPCPEMYQELYCLNGAKCFRVNIGHSPLYNCECADGFMGQRCQFKDPDGSYSRSRDAVVEQASIAGGAGVALLVCLLLSGLLYVWSKRRRKSASSTGQLTPRFGLRQSTSHVVQMEPPSAATSANQQPGVADFLELQAADRWTPPPPQAVEAESVPQAAPAVDGGVTPEDDASAAASSAVADVAASVAADVAVKSPSQPAPAEPQSRQCDRPP